MDIERLNLEKNKYIELYYNVDSIIKQLDETISQINFVRLQFSNYYSVNDTSFDNGKLSEIENKLVLKRDNLKEKILYSIELKINECKNKLFEIDGML